MNLDVANQLVGYMVNAPALVTLGPALRTSPDGDRLNGFVWWDAAGQWRIDLAAGRDPSATVQTLLHEAAHVLLGHVRPSSTPLTANLDSIRRLATLSPSAAANLAAEIIKASASCADEEDAADQVATYLRQYLAAGGLDLVTLLYGEGDHALRVS
jgi:hypothetical protein